MSGLSHEKEGIEAKVDEYVKPYLVMKDFSGSLLIAKDGEVLLSKGYGMANYELDVPNTPETKFSIGSISKQFTAAAILQLEERERLSVNDRLVEFLPDYPRGDKITLHNLLTHTSGITRNVSNIPELMMIPRTIEEVIELFKDEPFNFEPGERYGYSNAEYVLLAYIIEQISGQDYGEFLKENLFEPLDMRDTVHNRPETVLKHRASGYDPAVDGISNAPYEDPSNNIGAGSLYSTVEDLYKWDRALYTEKVLGKKSLRKLFTPYMNNYGYGMSIYQRLNRKVIGHDGSGHGFSAFLERFADDDACIIYVGNIRTGAKEVIAKDLAAILFREEYRIPAVRNLVELDPKIYDDYLGSYHVSPTMVLTVKRENDHLLLKGTGGYYYPLDPLSETKFFYRHLYAKVSFIRDEKGKVNQLLWRDVTGQEWACAREKS
jgi:CubicO group peptidase (beta-lactamase class C family)